MNKDNNSTGNLKRFCKRCGCYRTAVIKKKLVDFKVVGEYLACPFCGDQLDDASSGKSKSPLDGLFNDDSQPSGNVQESIFTDISEVPKPTNHSDNHALNSNHANSVSGLVFLDSDKEAHFCRDCEFFMYHPYKSYCCKHEKDVNSSDDCPDFLKRKH